ncbi:MAG: hypothetical protein E6J43_00320 [Chloroflexi bacterium]|nr:MAG: hypothetical protein E6J43_00320 [Chloroflexota bacterium]
MAAHKLLEGDGVALLRGGDERVVFQRSPLAKSTPQRLGWFLMASSVNGERISDSGQLPWMESLRLFAGYSLPIRPL